MTRHHRCHHSTGRTILLTDDDPDYLEVTRLLLESEGHRVLTANSGAVALEIAKQHTVDLVILDYFMPGLNGEEVVERLRAFDPHVQVVLQTGFSDNQPPREMLRRLDIQGYYDKVDGPEKLLLWTDAGLKAARTLGRLTRTARALRQVLELAPTLYLVTPPERLFETIADSVAQLMGSLTTPSRLEATPRSDDVLLAIAGADGALRIEAKSGGFANIIELDELSASQSELVVRAAELGQVGTSDGASAVPLRRGATPCGAILVRHELPSADLDVLRVFADLAMLGVDNTRRAASLQPSAIHNAAHFDRCLTREVRTALRSCRPLSLVSLKFVRPAPTARRGAPVDDLELASLAEMVVAQSSRPDDVLGVSERELWLLLPHTAKRGALRVLRQLLLSKVAGPVQSGIAMLATHEGSPSPSRATAATVSMVSALLRGRVARARDEADPAIGVPIRAAPNVTWTEVVTLPRGDAE